MLHHCFSVSKACWCCCSFFSSWGHDLAALLFLKSIKLESLLLHATHFPDKKVWSRTGAPQQENLCTSRARPKPALPELAYPSSPTYQPTMRQWKNSKLQKPPHPPTQKKKKKGMIFCTNMMIPTACYSLSLSLTHTHTHTHTQRDKQNATPSTPNPFILKRKAKSKLELKKEKKFAIPCWCFFPST